MSARYWMAFWPPPGPHAKPQGLAVHHKPHPTPERARRAFFHQTSRVASSLRQAGGPKTRTYSRLHSRNVRRIETIQDAPQGQITKTSRPRRGSLDRRARTRETHGMKMLIRCSSRGASSLSRGRASVPVGVLWLLSNRRCEAAWAVTDAVLGQFWAL